ncbi:MAG: amidohydrolase family protein [Armatimonadota bacterium]|nr:amidohydrolase family protein [Armatimonadota bacterium]MDR7450619.1 amidohydrolase family protein [Armatimonadota bacterium]MDR7466248.1 amidohydrolase family protein [Armatimonadota bacterium]MDR7492969.1 amidohydrolase family protein [Armatimonadota bacterium]MDR7498274.1 amidohydrolase family protein [Armatimonadota bacterium]
MAATPVIDLHSHFFPRGFVELVRRRGQPYGATVSVRDGTERLTMPGHPPIPLGPQFVDVDARRAAVAEQGIDLQVLSLSPPMVYWAPPDLGRVLAEAFNDGIAEICRAYPDVFLGAATLPLQDVSLALREAERALGPLGMRGVYVGSSVRGVYLDDPQFAPLWEFAQSRAVPVFTHPQHHLDPEALGRFHLANTIGFPTETALMAARLIYAGVLDRYPDVPVILAHGGGVLPFVVGRLDHAHSRRPECRDAVAQPPSAYLRRFIFDTVTHSDRALRFLVDVVGAERVALGSDAPYDMAQTDPVGHVRRLRLPPEAAGAVLGGTAAKLLQVSVPVQREG